MRFFFTEAHSQMQGNKKQSSALRLDSGTTGGNVEVQSTAGNPHGHFLLQLTFLPAAAKSL